jgi:probable phosphoglycerate mutase
MRRTDQTAAPFAEQVGIVPRVVRELREVDLGDWNGPTLRDRLLSDDPLALEVLREERWDVLPGAEPMEGFEQRVRRGVERVSDSIDFEQTAVAFVHGGVIGEVCRQATGSSGFAFIHAENGSITRVVVGADGDLTVRSFNETTHLGAG